ncbi:hypothetical protein STAIW_v1c07830 [Spiroplasma taiwanense CT-1]|uniref:Glycosyltransferase n=2 Tax=Spiroplasma taiwanense TaxID=2145 RepID=S5LUC7_9MOLU|nr:hypothetical protein STAIW_v1c07830 [Spiroplasma taiwanense CT-1]
MKEGDVFTSSHLNNQLMDDAIEKTSGSNRNNISVFYIIWSGQIQNLQTIWEIMLQKQLQPDKEIYLYLGADVFDPKIYDYVNLLGKNQNGKNIF